MPLTTTTVTEVTTTSKREVTKPIVTTQSDIQTLGNFVTDITIQPFIAPRTIAFYATNLRPNHVVHIFFDNVNVDQYCAPGEKISNDTSTSDSIKRMGNWGDALTTDANGTVAGLFSVPEGKFRTGERILQLSDTTNLTLGKDAMTMIASASFTASNISVTKDMVTLTTVTPTVSYLNYTETVVDYQKFTNTVIRPDIYNITEAFFEPIAQTLTINTPNKEAGVYATKIDLYFKQKSSIGNGVLFYICEMTNGYPNGKAIIPFSAVHVDSANINVSEDASLATTFTFDSPVFLNNDTEYAFVLKPDQNDPDVWIWTAELGNMDVTKPTVQVSSQPIVGTMFWGATATTWNNLPREYVKFTLYVAQFSSGDGDVYFTNRNDDRLTIYNVTYPNTELTIRPGDIVFQSTNSTTNSTGGTCNTSIYAYVEQYDPVKAVIYTTNSTGWFSNNQYLQIHRFGNSSVLTPNSNTIIAHGNSYVLYNARYDAVVPQFAYITPAGTTAEFFFQAANNSYAIEPGEVPVQPGYETELLDRSRFAMSRSIENAQMSNTKSMTTHIAMSSQSPLLSPLIDLVKFNTLALRNMLDPISSDYNEFFNSGRARAKYISKVITLADGQDAEDLQVIIAAHRPPSADIQVWARFLNAEDADPIHQKTWTPLRNLNADLFCDPTNPEDFRDFKYAMPYHYPMISTTGTITANDSNVVVTGTSTLFGNSSTQGEVRAGWYIGVASNATFNHAIRQVINVVNSTSLSLDAPFTANVTGVPYFLVPPPTTAWLSQNTTTIATGNVTVNTATNVITGFNTNFTNEFAVGDIISVGSNSTVTVLRDSQVVTGVTNSTYMTVGAPWTSNVVNATFYSTSSSGVTYLNNAGARYSTFKQFQIKIILQSNEFCKPPILDDLRVLALQL